jgi:DNA-binding transcriptional regulator YhcF (GntR family)
MAERLKTERQDLSPFAVDRTLDLPINVQLRGIIEYGIGLGSIRAGGRMPSVREMAEHLDISPVTVAQVYTDLKARGILHGRTGSGTYVADVVGTQAAVLRADLGIHHAIDEVVRRAQALGIRATDLVGLISARMDSTDRHPPRPSVAVIGNFMQITIDYCLEMEQMTDGAVAFVPMTITQVMTDTAQRRRAVLCQLIVTFPHRRREVQRLFPDLPIGTITFIPALATRMALAELSPDSQVTIVSVYPEFAPLMKAGVQKFAPHISEPRVVLHESRDLAQALAASDVVIYATGSDDLGLEIPPGRLAFEYRHSPNPHDVQSVASVVLGREATRTTAIEKT